ncbi:MAG: hypothetical protein JNG84_14875 [Archangium sp.]|nr:hypothetical protein [Archangium sp.]
MAFRHVAVTVVIALIDLACTGTFDDSRARRFACKSADDCNPGFVCQLGTCVSSDEVVPDAGEIIPTAADGGMPCSGCRASSGRCVVAPTPAECGSGGSACVACPGDQVCLVGRCTVSDGGRLWVDAGVVDAGAPDAGTEEIDAGPPFGAGFGVPFDGGPVAMGCAASGWCWVNPAPFPFSECTPVATSADGGYALLQGRLFRVGADGVAPVELGDAGPFLGAMALGTELLLTTDDGTAFHFREGHPLAVLPAPPINGLQFAASGSGELWASDADHSLARFDATSQTWTIVPLPMGGYTVSSMLPTGGGVGYFVLTSPVTPAQLIFFYDGGNWVSLTSAGQCLAGTRADDVLMSTTTEIVRLTPTGAVSLTPPMVASNRCVVHSAGDAVYASTGRVLEVNDGGVWRAVYTAPSTAISGLSMNGDGGLMCGPNWLSGATDGTWSNRLRASPVEFERGRASAVSVRDDGSAYLFFQQRTWHVDGGAGSQISALATQRLYVDLPGGGALTRSGMNDFFQFDGATLTGPMPVTMAAESVSVLAMSVENDSSAWAVGRPAFSLASLVLHWDGGTWDSVEHPAANEALQALASTPEATWLGVSDRLYLWENGGWTDAGVGDPGARITWLGAVSPSRVLVSTGARIRGWQRDAGWVTELDAPVYAVASDPATGTAVAVSSNQPGTVYVRDMAGVWQREALPGAQLVNQNTKAGIRGAHVWLAGDDTTVLERR